MIGALAVAGQRPRRDFFSLPSFEEDDSRKCFVFIFAIVGVGLLCGGIYFLASSTADYRKPLVEQYNLAVQNWTAVYMDEMLSSNFSIEVAETAGMSVNASGIFPLNQYEVPDAMPYERGAEDLLSYLSVRYTMQKIPVDITNITAAPLLDIRINATYRDKTAIIDLNPYPFLKFQYSNLNEKMCRNSGGYRYGNQCVTQKTLSEVCVAVELQNDVWVDSSVNCFRGGDDGAARYLLTQYYNPLYTPSVTFTLRSWKDPYLAAQDITDGEFFFGNTPKENFVAGVALVVVGGLLLLPCCVNFIVERSKIRDWNRYLEMNRSRRRSPDLEISAEHHHDAELDHAIELSITTPNTARIVPYGPTIARMQ